MKRIIIILSIIASFIPARAQQEFDVHTPKINTQLTIKGISEIPDFTNVQKNYDVYVPIVYVPLRYRPKATFRYNPKPYSEPRVDATVDNLKLFLERAKAYPKIKAELKGDWNDYVEIAAKYLAKGKSTEYIGDKKHMKYFQKDWAPLDRYIYDEKFMVNKQRVKQSINDSIAFRTKFVSDSPDARQNFVKDSIAARMKFVEDSLYRENYQKTHHYDHVVFDGPHGEPQLCYRKGKIIDGKIFNEYGLVSKVYKDGELIHDYEYSNLYLRLIKATSDSYPTGGSDDGVQIHDRVKRIRTFFEYDYPETIDYVLYYDADGLDEKKIE